MRGLIIEKEKTDTLSYHRSVISDNGRVLLDNTTESQYNTSVYAIALKRCYFNSGSDYNKYEDCKVCLYELAFSGH